MIFVVLFVVLGCLVLLSMCFLRPTVRTIKTKGINFIVRRLGKFKTTLSLINDNCMSVGYTFVEIVEKKWKRNEEKSTFCVVSLHSLRSF